MRQLVLVFLCTVFSLQGFASAEYDFYSPDRKIHVTVKETRNSISYALSYNGTAIIQQSALGLESTTRSLYEGGIKKVEKSTFKETWQPLFGKKSQVLNYYNQAIFYVQTEKGKIFNNYAVQKFKNQPYVLDEYGGIGWVFKSLSVAKNNSDQNIYIQSIKLNGQSLDRFWITHQEIIAGGILEMEMGPTPNIK